MNLLVRGLLKLMALSGQMDLLELSDLVHALDPSDRLNYYALLSMSERLIVVSDQAGYLKFSGPLDALEL